MNISFLVRGLSIGLAIAAPVGPIAVLCIRRSLARGKMVGLVSGFGAASADAVYGAIAGFGLTAISDLLIELQIILRLFGGLFLCYLGCKTFVDRPAGEAADVNRVAGAYASTFFLTLTNPMTIFSFAAIFAGLGLVGANSYFEAGILVLGVFLGSALWWLILVGFIGLFCDKFGDRALRWVNRISGVIILSFGIIAITTVFH